MSRPKARPWTPPERLADYPIGPGYASGHLVEKNAGWRTFRPAVDTAKCVGCLQCFLVCPDGAVAKTSDGIVIDYDFCKGCGVCAKECRPGAISMVKEVKRA